MGLNLGQTLRLSLRKTMRRIEGSANRTGKLLDIHKAR